MRLSDFKVLTFDMVGTIIDFETGILAAVRRIGGPAAAALSDDDIFAPYKQGRDLHPGRSSEVMGTVYQHLASKLGLPADDAAAASFQHSVLQWQPFADSAEALQRLRRRYRLVAMTNADRCAFSFYSQALGNPFHDSVTADESVFPKPDRYFFGYTLGRLSALGFNKTDILHVAQSQHHDMVPATALGYNTCWIERRQGQAGPGGTPHVPQQAKPHYHFATLGALADAVDAGH